MTVNVTWENLAEIARFAPTPHNTQPYRLRPTGACNADVVVVRDRLLPNEDHGNLYMTASIGVFFETLERAGRALGRTVETALDPALEVSRLHDAEPFVRVGTARIADAITPEPDFARAVVYARRTSRLPYDSVPIADEVVARLVASVASYGQTLLVDASRERVNSLLRYNAASIVDGLQMRGGRRETASWYRTGATPDIGDGLWSEPFCQPVWEVKLAFGAPALLSLPVIRQIAEARFVRSQRAPQVGFLRGPFLAPADLVRAGRSLMQLWLAMAKEGVYMHPMGSLLTNPVYAKRVAELVGHRDFWLAFRVGKSAEPARAPRLPAKEIVLR